MRFRYFAIAVAAIALFVRPAPTYARQAAPQFVRRSGKYQVELRVPAEGLFADDETDVEMRVTDQSQDDPVQGAPPVVRAKVFAKVTMPAMASMPAQIPSTHTEGVAGDYGVVLYFPHGGEYRLDLTIAPPGEPSFNVTFMLNVNDAAPLGPRPRKAPRFTLEVRAAHPPRAGVPVDLTLTIRDRITGKPVDNFDTVHEKKIHAIIVSSDLTRFAHEHPSTSANGSFALRYTFPSGGDYRVFADVAPIGYGSIVLSEPLDVAGGGATTAVSADTAPSDGVSVEIGDDARKLIARRSMQLTFRLTSVANAKPIRDLEPYLGAMGHLILIETDGVTFVHCHPDESDPLNGRNGTITFLVRCPKPGTYHGWLQFQRNGKVETSAFTLNVPERSVQ